MNTTVADLPVASAPIEIQRHSRLVRVTHWINALSFLFLVPSGIAILLAHPEFYWGETGYFGDPAALTLPLEPSFDYTAWGRGMHFLFAWLLVLNGLVYLLSGLIGGHFRRQMLPRLAQLHPTHLWQEIRDHLRFVRPTGEAVRAYNVLQKIAYLLVIFVVLPLMVLTGLTMSPAVTAAYPELFTLFGGRQSARFIHFICASALVGFLLIHIVMIFVVGFVNEIRSMITGKFRIEEQS
jgi:thiosulfate reductase cytochrome b subunit